MTAEIKLIVQTVTIYGPMPASDTEGEKIVDELDRLCEVATDLLKELVAAPYRVEVSS